VYHFAELPLKCRYFAPSDRNLLNEVIMTDLVTMRAEEKHCKFIAELARTKMATVGGGRRQIKQRCFVTNPTSSSREVGAVR
jgi:hypothetical protein